MTAFKIESHIASEQENPARLSNYAIGIFSTITSRQGIKKAIKKGLVKVNGEIAQTATFIHGGEEIELYEAPQAEPHSILELALEVIWEDDYLAIINKPAGIVVSGNKLRSVERALPYNLKKSSQLDGLNKPEPIHRLDYPTSGVLLIGKTRSAVIALNKLFEHKKIEKTYHAVTIGKMGTVSGMIDLPIEGKASRSRYEVLESQDSPKYVAVNLVKLFPETGRRHQLRIHLASLGNPIFGDKEHGIEGLILQGKGLYLHASSLVFQHPVTQESVQVQKALPKKFRKLFPDVSSYDF